MSAEPVRYFEDHTVGTVYPTKQRLITVEDQEAFCKLVGYNVPLFRDDEAGRKAGFKGRIAPSHLIMSFTTAMTGDMLQGSLIALLGIDGVKFLEVVQPGDTLRTEVEVIEKRESSKPDRGIVVFRDHVYNQHGREVFRNDKSVLMRRRPAA